MAKGSKQSQSMAPRILNRRARHDYHILETMEVGLVLRGTEVKAVRQGQCSIAEGFARVEPGRGGRNELWLYQVDIGPYSHAAPDRQHERKDRRKLLAHKREIERLFGTTTAKGTTLIPLALYFNERGIAKLELAVAQGKAKGDKRETMKEKEADKAIRRAMSRKRIG